jgi:hypothetical protein
LEEFQEVRIKITPKNAVDDRKPHSAID